jgi:putative tricarboxylic transport membrane protein
VAAASGTQRAVERTVLVCMGALFAAMATIAWGYGLRDRLGPGSGFFPFWLGVTGAAFSLALLGLSLRGHVIGEGGEVLWPDRAGAVRALLLLGGLVAAALALEPLGFRLTAAGFTALLLFGLGSRRYLLVLALAAASGWGLFHIFYYWLKVPLPVGTFGF